MSEPGSIIWTMIKVGTVGTIAGFIFSALGKGNIAKFINIGTILSCVGLITWELASALTELGKALNALQK